MRRIIFIGGGALVVIALAAVMIVGIQNRGKTATLDIKSIVPNDINVTLDGSKVASSGKVSVKPGEHTIGAVRSGFEDKTEKVTVVDGETKTVEITMTPNSEEGYQWAANHVNLFTQYEIEQGAAYDADSTSIAEKYPLIQYLPKLQKEWRVDYGVSEAHPDNPTAIAIIITAGSDPAKTVAEDWIKSLGFNLSDYEIIYQEPPTGVDQ